MDGDCDVDINDLDIFANDWLAKADDRTFAITAPAAPILWYKFNGTGDSNAVVDDYGTGDANNYSGTVINPGVLTWKTAGGRDGNNCLYLPPGTQASYISAPVTALSFMADATHDTAGGGGISFSIWINADMTATNMLTSWNGVFGVWDAAVALETLEVHCPAPTPPACNFIKRTPNMTAGTGTMFADNFGGKWNNWVFTKSADHMIVYCNGNVVAHADANEQPGDPNANEYGPLFNKAVGSFRVGTRGGNWGMWNGLMQDFKVWDYTLTPAEVAYLATDGSGEIKIPLISKANFVLDGGTANDMNQIVNFEDLSYMGAQWHQTKLWP